MPIPEPREDDSETRRKVLKVRVPVEQQIRLHTLKVMTGKTMSKAVEEALSLYFDEATEDASDEGGASPT